MKVLGEGHYIHKPNKLGNGLGTPWDRFFKKKGPLFKPHPSKKHMWAFLPSNIRLCFYQQRIVLPYETYFKVVKMFFGGVNNDKENLYVEAFGKRVGEGPA